MSRLIDNDEVFLAVWTAAHVPVNEIARVYGVSHVAIFRAARRFGMGPRRKVPAAPKPPVKSKKPPADLTEALVWSDGQWSGLAAVAERFQLTFAQVQQAYHRLRATGHAQD